MQISSRKEQCTIKLATQIQCTRQMRNQIILNSREYLEEQIYDTCYISKYMTRAMANLGGLDLFSILFFIFLYSLQL